MPLIYTLSFLGELGKKDGVVVWKCNSCNSILSMENLVFSGVSHSVFTADSISSGLLSKLSS